MIYIYIELPLLPFPKYNVPITAPLKQPPVFRHVCHSRTSVVCWIPRMPLSLDLFDKDGSNFDLGRREFLANYSCSGVFFFWNLSLNLWVLVLQVVMNDLHMVESLLQTPPWMCDLVIEIHCIDEFHMHGWFWTGKSWYDMALWVGEYLQSCGGYLHPNLNKKNNGCLHWNWL